MTWLLLTSSSLNATMNVTLLALWRLDPQHGCVRDWGWRWRWILLNAIARRLCRQLPSQATLTRLGEDQSRKCWRGWKRRFRSVAPS